MKRNLIVRKIGWGLLYGSLLIASVELGLNIIAFTSPKLNLMMKNRVGEPMAFQDERFVVRLNPDFHAHDLRGYRNPHEIDASDIVIVGDSQTWGVNAPVGESWPAWLRTYSDYEIYNMGVGGWGPVQYLLNIDSVLALKPKTVFTALYAGNDLWNVIERIYLNPVVDDKFDNRNMVKHSQFKDRAKKWLDDFTPLDTRAGNYATGKYGRPTDNKSIGKGSFDSLVSVFREKSRLYAVLRIIKGGLLKEITKFGNDDVNVQKCLDWDWESNKKISMEESGIILVENKNIKTTLFPGYRKFGVGLDFSTMYYEATRLTLSIVLEIHNLLKDAGIEHVVIFIPTKEMVYYNEVDDKNHPDLTQLFATERELYATSEAFLDRFNIPYINPLQDLMHAVSEGNNLYPCTTQSHPNSLGYRIIAGSVWESYQNLKEHVLH